MKDLKEFPNVFLYKPPVDMRKQIRGLSVLVQDSLDQNPFADATLYVFCNRRRDLLKLIYWNHSGFAMWVTQLDQEKFPWPKRLQGETFIVTPAQFRMLLEGYDIWKIKKHKVLNFKSLT